MRTTLLTPRASNHLQGSETQPHRTPSHPGPQAPLALLEQLARGAQGCSSPPLPHTLTLEAVVGMAQWDIAAVDDKIDLLQGQR